MDGGKPMLRQVLLTLTIALNMAVFCGAQDISRMDQIVQSYVANKTFMGSALVARGDRILLSKGYGFANLEWNVPNSPGTKFRLGSVTKQFTAASILLLEERGKLKTDDPVKKFMPDAPAAWDKITVFHLLTHTSGIPNFTGFPDYPKLEPFATTAGQLVARFRDKPLEFQPGEKWNYSNSGYVLLTYLIEKITGESYEKFVGENLFTPLAMKDSGYDSNSAVIPHRASGYVPAKNGFQNAGFVHMSIPQGAGALYSTTEDLLKWEQGLLGGKLLRPASLEKMTTPFKQNYAFGLQVETAGGHKVIEHGGGIEGFNTELEYYPDEKLTVVVLGNVNGSAPGEIAKKLAAAARGETVKLQSELKEIPLDPKVLGRLVGVYQLAPGINMMITLENNQLFSKLGTQQPVAIYPESETRFFPKVVEAELEFPSLNDKGMASEMILHQGGRDQTAKRLDDAEAKRALDAAAAFEKRFKEQTAAPGGEAALRKTIEELRPGQPNYDANLADKGALQSITFKGVGPGGADIYEVKFANGLAECRVWLGPDGKIERMNVRPQ
jgi:CubicO group peptidase (beta-lactamase class C family)